MTAVLDGPAQPLDHLTVAVALDESQLSLGLADSSIDLRELLADPLADPMGGGQSERTWRDSALCAQTDPEAFFPEKGGSTRAAKRICVGCEVRAECLEYALANDERFGIWGGLSERERRRLRQTF